MNKPNELTETVMKEIVDSIPSTADVWKELHISTEMVTPDDKQHLNTAAMCLHDLAEYLQFVGKGVCEAKCDWYRYKDITIENYPQQGKFLHAVHFARYHADHAINSLVAAMSHLANAAWHFFAQEQDAPNRYDNYLDIIKVLGRDAKSSSLAAEFHTIVSHPEWEYVHQYRNKWNHRELPRISGEMRRKKELIWQRETDPKPDWYSITKADGKGKVAYIGAGQFVHDYDMPKLFDCCVSCLNKIIAASRSFLAVFKNELQAVAASHGLTLTFDGTLKWSAKK